MFDRRGNSLSMGESRPEASLLTSTSASPVTGERMKWEGSSSAGEEGVGVGRRSVGRGSVSIRIERCSSVAFLKTWFVSSL